MASSDDNKSNMEKGYPATGYPSMVSSHGDHTNIEKGYPAVGSPAIGYPLPQKVAYPGYPVADYERSPASIVRNVILVMTAAVLLTVVLLFMLFFVIHPNRPVIIVENFAVSNFTINESRLDADWDLRIKVHNPNTGVEIIWEQIQISIFHKNNLLSNDSISEPLVLKMKDSTSLRDKLQTRQKFVDDDMVEERKMGFLDMRVKMSMLLKIKSRNEDVYMKDTKVHVLCENLRLDIEKNSMNGSLAPGSWVCLLFSIN